jgi:hypothetical protein
MEQGFRDFSVVIVISEQHCCGVIGKSARPQWTIKIAYPMLMHCRQHLGALTCNGTLVVSQGIFARVVHC